MPTNRITMRQIRETLRLHLCARLSFSEVGQVLPGALCGCVPDLFAGEILKQGLADTQLQPQNPRGLPGPLHHDRRTTGAG